MTHKLDLNNEPQLPIEFPYAPWYNKHYIGRFATDAQASAEIIARAWDNDGENPESAWYYNTTSKSFKYWNGTAWTDMGASGGTYTTTEPTTETVGGIVAGSEYSAATMQEVFDDLLHPYQSPTFSSFAMTGVVTVEVGYDISGAQTFTWGTTNSSNVTANSLSITDVTGGSVVIESGLANNGSKAHTFSSPATRDTAGIYRFTISGTDTESATFTRNLDINFYWKVYYGESTQTSLNESQIEALRVGGLQSGFAGTYAYVAAAGYKYIAIPTAHGTISSFKDASTGLDVPFEAPATVSVTNAEGVTTDYYVYRSTNQLAGAFSIIMA